MIYVTVRGRTPEAVVEQLANVHPDAVIAFAYDPEQREWFAVYQHGYSPS